MKTKLLLISLFFSFLSVAQQPFYFNDFEGLPTFTTDNSGLWQKGVPAGNSISAAHSGSEVWMTNLNSTYSYSFNDRYLYTPVFCVKEFKKVSVSFWHAFNLDTMSSNIYDWYSMGSFEYRTANSSAWIMLGYIGDPQSNNWFNTNIGGSHCWTFLDSSWFYSSYEYNNQYPSKTDSLQFRFVFRTYHNNHVNFNATGDGWAIDDFQINGHYYSNELALKKIIKPVNNSYGMDTVKIRIVNLGSVPYKPIAISYRVGTNAAVTESFTGNPIPQGDSLDYAFNTLLSLPQSNYNICTYLTTYDTYKGNDTLCSSIITTDIFSSESFYINSISPNPVKDDAQIFFNLRKEENIDFNLFNSTGAVVYHTSAHFNRGSNSFKLNFAELPKGIYFLQLKVDFATVVKRIIIL